MSMTVVYIFYELRWGKLWFSLPNQVISMTVFSKLPSQITTRWQYEVLHQIIINGTQIKVSILAPTNNDFNCNQR